MCSINFCPVKKMNECAHSDVMDEQVGLADRD